MIENLRLVDPFNKPVKIEHGWTMKTFPESGTLQFINPRGDVVGFIGNTVRDRELTIGALANAHYGFSLLPELIAAASGLRVVDTFDQIVDGIREITYVFADQ